MSEAGRCEGSRAGVPAGGEASGDMMSQRAVSDGGRLVGGGRLRAGDGGIGSRRSWSRVGEVMRVSSVGLGGRETSEESERVQEEGRNIGRWRQSRERGRIGGRHKVEKRNRGGTLGRGGERMVSRRRGRKEECRKREALEDKEKRV